MAIKGSSVFPKPSLQVPEVTQAELDQSVSDLETSIAALPTTAQLNAVKADVTSIQGKVKDLETDKADQTSVDKANAAIKDLDTSLKALAALPPDVSQDELNTAVADVEKKIKAADDAIATVKKSVELLLAGPRIVYTTATTLKPLIDDSVHIDGAGDIELVKAPADGAEIRIYDPFGKIKAGKNNVLLGVGDRWLIHDGTFDTTSMTFEDNPFRNGYMTLKYSAPTQSWWPYVMYGVPMVGSVSSLPGVKPAIATANNDLTVKPFELVHLKGTGNIQIGTFAEFEYFEVQWSGSYDVTVMRPVGFTIDQVNDDLRLDTADMGVRRVRFTLIGNNFEVT